MGVAFQAVARAQSAYRHKSQTKKTKQLVLILSGTQCFFTDVKTGTFMGGVRAPC